MGAQNHNPIGRHIPVKVFWGVPPGGEEYTIGTLL